MRSPLFSIWRAIAMPPDELAVERRRSYEIMAEIYLLAFCVQAAAAPLIYAVGHAFLGHLDLLCLCAYAGALWLHRRLLVAWALALKLSAFLLFVSYGVVVVGDGQGSSLIYYLLFAEVELMLADLHRRTKIAATAGLIVFSLIVTHLPTPASNAVSAADSLLSDLGLALVFVMLCIVILRTLTITDRLEHRYRRDAMHDSLTLVLNRRAVFERASLLWKAGRSFSVVLVDADRFKEINDNYGHTAGDAVLHHLAGLLRDSLRGDDCIGRVGGEEFLILLPGAGAGEALSATARIREHLARQPCLFDGVALPVTLSMGVARSREGRSLRDVVELADRRLYAAKSEGRDRVVVEGHDRSAASRNAQRLAEGAESALSASAVEKELA